MLPYLVQSKRKKHDMMWIYFQHQSQTIDELDFEMKTIHEIVFLLHIYCMNISYHHSSIKCCNLTYDIQTIIKEIKPLQRRKAWVKQKMSLSMLSVRTSKHWSVHNTVLCLDSTVILKGGGLGLIH